MCSLKIKNTNKKHINILNNFFHNQQNMTEQKFKMTKQGVFMEKEINAQNNEAKQTGTKQTTSRPKRIGASKKKRKANGSTLAIVALSVLLALSVVFGMTMAFFSASAGASGKITLGDPVNVNITQGGTTVTTITFNGLAMPGTTYSQPIGVTLPANTSDAVVRGKLSITNSDEASTNVTAITNANWTLGEDDYYYYNGKLSAGQSQEFVTSVTVPKSLTNADANKTFALSVQIEAIQFANGAAAEVWTTAPQNWITAYGSGTISNS